jgi:hypothetical protein
LPRVQRLCLANEFAVDACQTREILRFGEHLGFKRLQAGGQRHPAIPDLLRTDQPERRIVREALGIIDILIARHTAVQGLTEQIGQWKLGVLAAALIAEVLGDEISQAQAFIQLAHEDEVAIRGDP